MVSTEGAKTSRRASFIATAAAAAPATAHG
jgi:hypothetical protein